MACQKARRSGSKRTSTSAAASVPAPLHQNSQRQPSPGRIAAAATPPRMPPIETQTTPKVTARLRQRATENSAIIAAAVPGTPPRPTPASILSAASARPRGKAGRQRRQSKHRHAQQQRHPPPPRVTDLSGRQRTQRHADKAQAKMPPSTPRGRPHS
jgi:hypothetical protein